jgi:hypothetical protein
MPNNPVTCSVCGSEWGFPKDRLCRVCRPKKRRKYLWTPSLDAELRRIYADNARHRPELGSAIHAFSVRIGWPVLAVTQRAIALKITTYQKYPWTRHQDALLCSLAGESIRLICKKLHRSETSIRNRMSRLRISGKYLEGYSQDDLIYLFGVGQQMVRRWMDKGWLRRSDEGRIPEQCVRRFLRSHAEEYDLKRVDQAWFKGMIFPSFGQHAHRMRDNASHSPYKEVA